MPNFARLALHGFQNWERVFLCSPAIVLRDNVCFVLSQPSSASQASISAVNTRHSRCNTDNTRTLPLGFAHRPHPTVRHQLRRQEVKPCQGSPLFSRFVTLLRRTLVEQHILKRSRQLLRRNVAQPNKSCSPNPRVDCARLSMRIIMGETELIRLPQLSGTITKHQYSFQPNPRGDRFGSPTGGAFSLLRLRITLA